MNASLLKVLGSTFIFTVFSNTAWADKNQILISAPMAATQLTCAVLNVSDRVIPAPQINVTDHIYDFYGQEPINLQPGEVVSRGLSNLSGYYFCVVEWLGTPGEIRASACAIRDDVLVVEEYTCLELH